MVKLKQIEEHDFNFSKRPMHNPGYCIEKMIAGIFIAGFLTLFSLFSIDKNYNFSPSTSPAKVNSEQLIKPQYQDYLVTPEDNKLFASIFNYDENSSLSKDSDIKFYQQKLRQNDVTNSDFANKEPFTVQSSILVVEPSNKDLIVKETGYPNLDYVDVIVQKKYTQNKEVYYEQQIVSLRLENHKIITMNIHRMID